jgi:predicted small metal-binding protein
MKKLVCDELVNQNCGFIATAETEEEVKQIMGQHGDDVHSNLMAAVPEADRPAKKAEMARLFDDKMQDA